MVLACLAMLMVGLMLMLSFNVTNAIHERIRIQATADSQALSTATLEARAMNTMAFMNRSIAGAMVAQMTIHAWYTIGENEVGMLNAGAMAFIQVAAQEAGRCSKWQPQHCIDAAEATKIMNKFKQEKSSYQSALNGSKFTQAVSGLQNMMKDLHADQKKVLDNTKNEIATTSQTFRNLKSISAPYASYSTVTDGMNVSEFACALEGSNFDGDCQGQSWKPAGTKASASDRARIMESAAMAARPKFTIGTGYWRKLAHADFNAGGTMGGPGSFPEPINGPKKPKNIQSSGNFDVMVTTLPKTWVRNNEVGAEISPGAPSILNVSWRHGTGMFFTSGSGASPKGRKTSGNPYVGVPCTGDNCFINFRANTSANGDYGQPATYGALSQDLRLQLNGKRGPWEVNQQGTIRIKLERNRETRLILVPQGRAYAVAKGKTYFHQLGSWQTPPNMFDPFWRAKLQSFQKDELRTLLQRVGDTQGANIIGSGGAIEGKLQ